MTPMSETQPTPGHVIGADDVPKLRAGDVLRCVKPCDEEGLHLGNAVFSRVNSVGLLQIEGLGSGEDFAFFPHRFEFVRRPSDPAFRLSPPAGSPPSSKTEHVAGDAVSGAVERLESDLRLMALYQDEDSYYRLKVREDDLRTILAEIADLKARNKALAEGLLPLAGGEVRSLSDEDDIPDSAVGSVTVTMGDLRRARTLTEADHGR